MRTKLNCAILAFLLLSGTAAAQQKQDFDPVAKATKRTQQLLQPGGVPDTPFGKAPLPRRPTSWIERPEPPMPVFHGTPPYIRPESARAAPPSNPPESPLHGIRSEPSPPFTMQLPSGYLVAYPSMDVNQPLAPPILAQASRERASITDPTYDHSVAVILAAVDVIRAAPVPFTPINLPDPFENAQAVRLRFVLDEDPNPPLLTPRPPRR